MRRLALAVALCALGHGCDRPGDGDTYVWVEVRPGAVVPAVHRLELELRLGDVVQRRTIVSPAGEALALPGSAALHVRAGAGPLAVDVVGFGSDDGVVGLGAASGTVVRGRTARVVVTLVAPLAGPHLDVDPSHDFGTVNLGSEASAEIAVRNDGTEATGRLAATLADGELLIKSGTCMDAVLAPRAACTIVVVFRPTTAGAHEAALVVSGAGGERASVALQGTGAPSSGLTLSPPMRVYGDQPLGQASAPSVFRLVNATAADVEVVAARLDGSDAVSFAVSQDACAGRTLHSGDECLVEALFRPQAARAHSAQLVVGGVAAQVSGRGLGPAVLGFDQTSVEFGMVPMGATARRTVRLSNSGQSPSGTLVFSAGPDFAVATPGCPATLPGGMSCDLELSFRAVALGARNADLVVSDGTHSVTLRLGATGATASALIVTPDDHDFGSLRAGTTSVEQMFTVENRDGSASAALTSSVTSDFELTSDGCTGTTLAPLTSCTLRVRARPSPGSHVGGLTVQGAGSVGLATLRTRGLGPADLVLDASQVDFGGVTMGSTARRTVRLSNRGDSASGTLVFSAGDDFAVASPGCPAVLSAGQFCDFEVSFQARLLGPHSSTLEVSDGAGSVSAALTASSRTPSALRVTFDDYHFGSFRVGVASPEQPFTVTNQGGSPSAPLTTSVTPDFMITNDGCAGNVLAPMAACTVRVLARATTTGERVGALTVMSGTTMGSATLRVRGLGPAMLTLDVARVDFGGVTMGSTVRRTVRLSNPGESASAMLLFSAGVDFVVARPGCPATLGAGQACDFELSFTAGAVGLKSAMLVVSDGAASVGIPLTASSLTPSNLRITPREHDFGSLRVGVASPEQPFTVENQGGSPSSALTTSVTTDFEITSDGCLGNMLAPMATCIVRVRARPSTTGARDGGLSASAGGTVGSATLHSAGLSEARLSATPSSLDFGLVERTTTKTLSWTVRNDGDLASVVPTFALGGSHAGMFATSGCTASLAGHSECTLSITYTPTTVGLHSASVTADAGVAGQVSVMLRGAGGVRITVSKAGTGTVTSNVGGVDCGTMCSALVDGATQVTLTARTSNGSGYYFSGWTGTGCAGPARACQISVGTAATVTATFSRLDYNLVFLGSQAQPGNLGGTQAYDAQCNAMASAAGINNGAGTAYVAWLSSPSSNARARLGSARYFVRPDGRVFTDDLTLTLSPGDSRVFTPVKLDENGVSAGSGVESVWTGTRADGSTATETCGGWTGAGTGSTGLVAGGPYSWTEDDAVMCAWSLRIICMMRDQTAVGPPPARSTGKLLFMSTTGALTGGGVAALDTRCQAERPAGHPGSFRAWVATTTRTAASLVDPAASYVTTGGQPIATGEQLRIQGGLDSGVWQFGNGEFIKRDPQSNDVMVANGAHRIGDLAVSSENCANYTATSGGIDFSLGTRSRGWWGGRITACSAGDYMHVYCIEQ